MKKNGFTMIEMLIVISIIAILATLVTSAAKYAMRLGREHRIKATAVVLESAIQAYKTSVGSWPFTPPGARSAGDFVDQKKSNNESGEHQNVFWIHGGPESKAGQIFAKVYKEDFLDGSGITVLTPDGIKRLNQVGKSHAQNIQVCYPDIYNTSKRHFYCIRFNRTTDAVTVHRQDSSEDHGGVSCPNYDK